LSILLRVGINKGTFSRMWKEGAIPKGEHLLRIAKATGASIDWLLTGEGPMMRGEGEVAQGGESLQDLNRRREDRFVDKFLAELDNYLTSQEKEEPGYRAWFRIECKKRFPELFQEKKQAETEGDKGPVEQKMA
jgi:transcriptional regulator with XRE-family HTH domain